jgi:hypothetical protein
VAGENAPEPRRITDRQRNKENELEKRPTVKAVWQKTGMAIKKNIYIIILLINFASDMLFSLFILRRKFSNT